MTGARCREVVGCVVTAEIWVPAVLVPSAENCNTASNTAKKFRAWADLLFARQWHFAVNSISSKMQTSIAPVILEKVSVCQKPWPLIALGKHEANIEI